jgi:LEA14-like dessication related protein
MAYFGGIFANMEVQMRGIKPGCKMTRTVILLGLITITSQLSGCALLYRDLQPPTAELVAIQPEGLQNNLSLAVLTRLRITNPNSVALPIEGGRLEISLNGQPVANSTLTEDFTVPANSSIDIDIRINVNLAAGLAIGLGVLNSQQTDIGWQLSGHVDVGIQYLGRVKIEESGTIQLAAKGAISN